MIKFLNNKNGSVLIIAYMVLYMLLSIAAGFAMFHFSELNYSQRYRNAASAFWLAESGIVRYLKNPGLLTSTARLVFDEPNGQLVLTRDDSDPAQRTVTATAEVRGSRRSIQVVFQSNAPEVFNNTMSVVGDMIIDGKRTALNILDKGRISGKVRDQSAHASVLMEDLKEGFNPQQLRLIYPDADGNGVEDQFNDFVEHNRRLVESYPREDVIYLQGNGTFTLTPDSALIGKKLIFVDGREGHGNVIIQFGGGMIPGQKLTVISTGMVTFNQAGSMPAGAQLNIISWSGYRETAVLPALHRGMIYTRGTAVFDGIHDSSVTEGCIVAGAGMRFGEIWSTKNIRYRDVRVLGVVPPGFEGLYGGGGTGYVSTASEWREVQ